MHERYVGDITGQPLSPELCRKARATEPDYFRDKEVWTIRKINEALRRTGKPPIRVRWVEVNKGDELNPKITEAGELRGRLGPRARRRSSHQRRPWSWS